MGREAEGVLVKRTAFAGLAAFIGGAAALLGAPTSGADPLCAHVGVKTPTSTTVVDRCEPTPFTHFTEVGNEGDDWRITFRIPLPP